MKNVLTINAVTRNIIWARDNSRWACFRVTPHEYGLRKRADKVATRTAHRELINLLPNASMYMGLQTPMAMRTIARSMAAMKTAADAKRYERYFRECNQKLKELESFVPYERCFYVIAPLDKTIADAFGTDRVKEAYRSWRTGETATTRLSDKSIASASELSDKLHRRLSPRDSADGGSGFRLTPLTPDEIRWIWHRIATRGADATPRPDFTHSDPTEIFDRRHFTRAVTDAGATTDIDAKKGLTARFTRPDPVVKTTASTIDGTHSVTGYQSFLVVEQFATKQMVFPGGTEVIDVLDEVDRVVDGTPVTYDWVIRTTKRTRERTQLENVRNLQRIGDQIDQRDSELSFASNTLAAKAHSLAEFNARIENDSLEFGVGFTTIFAIGSRDKAATSSAAAQLQSRFRSRMSMKVVAPNYAQLDLMAAATPGTAHNRVIDDYLQTTTSIDFAELAPFTTATVGDGVGPVIGINLSSGNFDPVHLDLVGATSADSSACVGVVGELGSGKSYFIKTTLALVHQLGGQFIAIDRTAPGEYEVFARALTSTQVVDFENPRISIDPLHVLDQVVGRGRRTPEQVVDFAVQVLTSLFNLGNTSVEAHLLATQLDPGYRERHNIRSTRDLARHTIALADAGGASPAVEKLAHLHTIWIPRAPAIFDDTLPSLDLDSAGIVFRTHGLSLPTKEEMNNPIAFEHLELAKRKGHVYYGLAARIAREVLFGPERFGILATDEAHHFDDTTAGEVFYEFIRDGRKNNAGMIVGSHDADTDFPEIVRKLMPYRILFRHRDEGLAEAGLRWIGADLDAYPWLVKEVTHSTSPLMPTGDSDRPKVPMHRRGEGYFADAQKRLARFKSLGPADPATRLAVSTTPEDLARMQKEWVNA